MTPPLFGTVAVVGFPNVGKSTLVNRLSATREAVVFETPGVTRDRNVANAEWAGREFVLIDTGGLDEQERSSLAAAVRAQSLHAAEEADVVIALFDGRAGLTPKKDPRISKTGRENKVVREKDDTPLMAAPGVPVVRR